MKVALKGLVGVCIATILSAPVFPQSTKIVVANLPLVVNQNRNELEIFFSITPVILPVDKSKTLDVTDLTKNSNIVFSQNGQPEFSGSSGNTGYWRTAWKLGALRPGISESRVLLVKFGDVGQVVPITLQPSSNVQVTLTGPGLPIRLINSRSASIRLLSPTPLTQVSIVQSTLADEKSGRAIPLNQLIITDTPPESLTTENTQKTSDQVKYLSVQSAFATPGKFVGTITLTSQEKPDLGSFSLAVYSTSRCLQFVGLVCLGLGLLTYMGIAIWARYQSRRLAMLLPAARLRDEANRLLELTTKVRKEIGFEFRNLLADKENPYSLLYLLDQLSESKLANYLPPPVVSPFASPEIPTAFQSFLQTIQVQIANLSMIVRWGLASVLAMWPSVQTLGLEVQGNLALQTLDGLSTYVGPPDQLRNQIQAALSALQVAISNANASRGGGAATAAVYDVGTSQQLIMQIDTLNATVWIIWAALTIAIGSSALIWFNDGFGTPQDMIQCFLWGVGVPAIAQGFGGLSSGSATSAFALQIPR
jgi:hypothetical protein